MPLPAERLCRPISTCLSDGRAVLFWFHRAAPIPDYRAAGVLLLLTAAATAASVGLRLLADADQPTAQESLYAIADSRAAYGFGGAARLASGLVLWAAAGRLSRLLPPVQATLLARAAGVACFLLAASGIVTAVSGVCAIALALLAPGGGGDVLLAIRWATGALGFTLAGLALAALAPAQWRTGGVMRVYAVAGAALGVAMLFIWLDSATLMHRLTGIAFLVWLILAGLWLLTGRVAPPAGASQGG